MTFNDLESPTLTERIVLLLTSVNGIILCGLDCPWIAECKIKRSMCSKKNFGVFNFLIFYSSPSLPAGKGTGDG
jgi:hypothetical protein